LWSYSHICHRGTFAKGSFLGGVVISASHNPPEYNGVKLLNPDGSSRTIRSSKNRWKKRYLTEYQVAACDLFFPRGTMAARYIAAYRTWLGIEPYAQGKIPAKRKPQKATEEDLDLTHDIELIALAVKGNAISCRIPGKGHVTLRSTRSWDVVPGELITVTPRKKWRYAGHPYLSGEIKAGHLDVAALGLKLLQRGRGKAGPKGLIRPCASSGNSK
jgi:hypothetical protein